ERSASGVPQVRRTDALVRHHGVPGLRLRSGHARRTRIGSGAHPHRGRTPRHDFSESIHRRDPGLQHSTAGCGRVHPALDSGAIGRGARTQPAHGVTVRGIGGPGGNAAGGRHRDVRAQPGWARNAPTGGGRPASRAEPRGGRRQRLHDRGGHRRDRHARFLAAVQVTHGGDMTSAIRTPASLGPVPEGFDRHTVEQFLYREARLADEGDYDAWEALWTDDALSWVPIGGDGGGPQGQMAVIAVNRNRISTRLKQLHTGKRYAQAPPSNLRRLLSNIEFLGGRENPDGGIDLEVGANFLAIESRARGTCLWGGRTTYRLRRRGDDLLLAYKKVVLVDNDHPLPTLGFLI